MADNTTEEEKLPTGALPTGSVTASWVQLDPKNGKPHEDSSSSGSEGVPQYSDDSNGEAMTAELADASRSLYNSSTSTEIKNEKSANSVEEASPPKSEPTTLSSAVPYVSTILITASIALIIGFAIGRKLNK